MRNKLHLFLLFVFATTAFTCAKAQNGVVFGTITDENNLPIMGANVVVKGTSIGTVTNIDGQYELIKLAEGETTISISFIGYNSKDKLFEISGRHEFSTSLDPSNIEFDELIVIGYGKQKKSLVTGTIARIESEDISKGVVRSGAESLQGKAAGVVVQAASGQPGDGLSLNIRGISTTGNSQPLFVVDGMPVDDIGFLNPTDIKSMEVLKDAAAASIYGARGGNGVVLVTTMNGTSGMSITYDGYYGIQNPWQKPEILSAYDYALVSNEARRNDGFLDVPFPDASANMEGTDWWEEIRNKNAPIHNHNLSIAGGNNDSKFNSSFSYFSQEGTFAPGKSEYERLTGRISATHKHNRFNITNSLSYTFSKAYGFDPNDGFSRGAMITAAMNYDPTAPVYDEDGEYYHSIYKTNEYTNPVATLSLINNETKVHKILGNLAIDVDLIDGLTFKTNIGVDGTFNAMNSFSPEFFFDEATSNPSPSVSNRRESVVQWQIENTLNYQEEIKKHNFSILVGQSALEQKYEGVIGTANDLQFNEFEYAYINNTLDPTGTRSQGTYIQYRLASYFGRLTYSYDEKYLFSAITRADGSSRFGGNNKFGVFPSVSGGWVISNENFYPSNSLLNFAKVRVSWGQNGNDRIGDFAYTALLEINSYVLGEEQNIISGQSPAALANDDLKWETIEQSNIGVDLGLLNNKLTFSSDFYIKTTRDILIVPDIPAHAGFNPPAVNGGTVENRGIELELKYKQLLGEFDFNVGLTYAYNKNTMTEINNTNKAITGASAGYYMPNVTMAFENEAINSFYGLETDGIFQSNAEVAEYNVDGFKIQPDAVAGDLRYIDQNGDGRIDSNDRVVIGNPIPSHTIGLNLNANWKGFDMNMFIYSALDYQIFNAIRRSDYPYQNYTSNVNDRWRGKGTSDSHPRVTELDPNKNYTNASTFMVEDADMVRLKKLSLGYTLPNAINEKIGIEKLRIYFAAENLVTFTKYTGLDPEIGSSGTRDQGLGGSSTNSQVQMDRGIDHGVYPMPKSFIAGISLTF